MMGVKNMIWNSKIIKDEAGITLLEILLVIGLFAAISLGVVELSNSWAKQQRSEIVANHLMSVKTATEDYIRDNFQTVRDAVAFAGGTMVLPIEDPGAGLFLKEGNVFLPSGFKDENLFSQQMEVLVRNIGADTIQAMVVTTGRAIDVEEALAVVQAAGVDSGLVVGQDMGGYDTTQFSGYGSGWSVPLASYVGTGWALANPVGNDTAHLVALATIDRSAGGLDNYLYRVDVGDPDANRMSVDLDMNGNNLNSVGNLSADFANIDGDMTVESVGFTVSEGMVIEGNLNADSLDVGALAQVLGETQSLNVSDMLTLGDVNAAGNLSATDITGNGSDAGVANNTQMQAQGGHFTTSLSANRLTTNNVSFSGAGSSITLTDDAQVDIGSVFNTLTIETPALGAASLQNIGDLSIVGGEFEVRQAIEITGSVNFNGPVTDEGGHKGNFDPSDVSSVNMNVSIGTLGNCPETTAGVCCELTEAGCSP